MLKKLIYIVSLLLVLPTLANALPKPGKVASCIYCHNGSNGNIPIGLGASGCGGCHTSPPTSGAHLNHTDGTGAVYGSDANNSVSTYRFNCGSCHPTNPAGHGNSSLDLELYSAAATGLKKNNPATAGRTGTGAGTVCRNIYCHSAGQPAAFNTYTATPPWGGNLSGNRCTGCHSYPPNYTNNAPKANSHVPHNYNCGTCHAGTTADGTTISNPSLHVNGTFDVTPGSGVSFSYSYAPSGGTCSNISCHGGNGIITNVGTAQWGAALGCAGCHGDSAALETNAHAKHVNILTGKGYACAVCHASTVSGSTSIINPGLHANSAVDVAGSFTYNPANKSCAATCHLGATPQWSAAASGACGSCHAALSSTANGLNGTNAHSAHFTAAYGPNFNSSLTSSCAVCHTYSAELAATHVDGAVDLGAGFSKVGTCSTCHQQTTNWSGGQISCESCHTTTGGPLSIIGGLTAPDMSLSASTGHGKSGIGQACTACHDRDSTHTFTTVSSTRRLLPALTGSLNTECTYCHDNAAKISNAGFRNISTHFTARSGGQAMGCATCHDPHGTTNLSQIRITINGQTITYTDRATGLVNTVTNQGLCQVCHTQTVHFNAGSAESNHPTSNCFNCHRHNASGGAFKPNGACDSCHGYPPAPREVASAVNFGTMNNWSSARIENYSGGGGAHLVGQHVSPTAKPSEGWANCTLCHNGGVIGSTPYHIMTTPVKNHIDNVTVMVDPKFHFSEGFTIYTGGTLVNPPVRNATGSCLNISCHMQPSPSWSTER